MGADANQEFLILLVHGSKSKSRQCILLLPDHFRLGLELPPLPFDDDIALLANRRDSRPARAAALNPHPRHRQTADHLAVGQGQVGR